MRQNIGLAKNFVLVYPYHLMENLNELFGQPNKWAPYHTLLNIWLPRWFSGKESTCQSRRCRLDLWLGKIPWRRKRQPASIFLPGKTLGQRSLTGNSPRSWKGVGHGLVSQFSSVQSLSHVWLQFHGLKHARLPYPSSAAGAYSSSYPSSWWCHPTISFSVIPFSSCLQSFPSSGSFQMSQFFAAGGQSIEVSASGSVLSMNIQDWFPLEWTGLISLQSKGLSRVFSNTTVQKH